MRESLPTLGAHEPSLLPGLGDSLSARSYAGASHHESRVERLESVYRKVAFCLLSAGLGLAIGVASTASAVSLGEAELQSELFRPLDARLPLSLSGGERLEALNIRVNPANGAGEQVRARLGGTQAAPVVQLYTEQAMREPMVLLRVTVDVAGAAVSRDVTLLLDMPAGAANPPLSPTSSTGPTRATAAQTAQRIPNDPALTRPSTSAPAPSSISRQAAARAQREAFTISTGASTVTVPDGATLSEIAQALKPRYQMPLWSIAAGLFAANPEAFGGSMDQLRAGSRLRLPARIDTVADARAAGDQPLASPSNASRQSAPRIERPVETFTLAAGLSVQSRQALASLGAVARIRADEPPVPDQPQAPVPDVAVAGSRGVQDTAQVLVDNDAPLQVDDIDVAADVLASNVAAADTAPERATTEPATDFTSSRATPREFDTAPADVPAVPVGALVINTGEPVATRPLEAREQRATGNSRPVIASPMGASAWSGRASAVLQWLEAYWHWLAAAAAAALLLLWFQRRRAVAADTAAALDDDVLGSDEDAHDRAGPKLVPSVPAAAAIQATGAQADEASEPTKLARQPADVEPETDALDANTPRGEAVLHELYGEYDQAAEVLQRALASSGGGSRISIVLDLLRLYRLNNNREDFISLAYALKDDYGPEGASVKTADAAAARDPRVWAQIHELGQGFLVNARLFGGSGISEEAPYLAASSSDWDFDFDDPVTAPTVDGIAVGEADMDSVDFDFDTAGQSGSDTRDAQPVRTSSIDDDTLDIDLGETTDAEELAKQWAELTGEEVPDDDESERSDRVIRFANYR